MAATTDIPRPSRLWRGLNEQHRTAAAEAFWADEQSIAEQAEVISAIARQLNFRPKSVLALPVEKKVRHTVRMGQVSDGVAGRLLVAYHLAAQRPMMAAFLDALGIAHDSGLITEEEMKAPEAGKLAEAVTHLSASFPAEDVQLYFATLVLQDPDTWGGLAEHLGAGSQAGAAQGEAHAG
jgi:hypothetical protein